METKNLMLGDLVLYDNTKLKVFGIDQNGVAVGIGEQVQYHLHDEELRPIPITPDILKENGFEVTEQDAVIITLEFFSINEKGNELIVMKKPKGGYKVLHGNASFSQKDILFGDGDFICYNCDYIHEIQHIMRMCCFEKQIEL